MISTQLMQHITQIRRTDNVMILLSQDSTSHFNHLFKIDGTHYFEQLQLILQVYIFAEGCQPLILFLYFKHIQEAQRLNLKNTTKFLAKKYFDIFLSKYPDLPEQNCILVIITCLRTAVKFNQTIQVSQFYTMEFCLRQCQGKYSIDNFIECQIQLLKALNFKLRLSSPYQFIVVQCLLPHLKEAMNILNLMIDFALTLPQLRAASAEGIFFGALLYSCKQKNQLPICYNIINAITYKWQQANQISLILGENLARLSQE